MDGVTKGRIGRCERLWDMQGWSLRPEARGPGLECQPRESFASFSFCQNIRRMEGRTYIHLQDDDAGRASRKDHDRLCIFIRASI
jgi:hypothetical protein